ncbi:major facilitator superfamily transporter [Cucurbitaria berberidis CBS 394.84]|uniref:Major facilitator superfamily transporter n=1 Tax=Cucurbitaria berberidis CBS 394.84 TaxID=1168544 RepID=A0A9P4GQP3_9PLEO|nr:major facilitator superfamily transporter [Cucurbitaria berberidis CBS 394.84]KAF1849564.1 major facilitator superfamily transporter [Cucurbitaria berberidis CBS 394.84]
MTMPVATTIPRDRWWKVKWFSDDDTKEERRLITKIDMFLVPYSVLGYWVKYIDQSNLNNAYVAGMKEDLGFDGNELVQLQTLFTLGSVLGQIPFLFIMTYIPIQWLIPACDILWGVFTLLQYRVHSYAELAAYRFMIGWFEAAFFPAMHYVFGSWYRGHEIARRGGIFYTGLGAGTLTAGLIQAGASKGLEGVHGMEGWRWMYIICAIITIPVGILGFFVIPGTVDQPNRWVVNDNDIAVARDRLEKHGHVLHGKMKFGHVKRTLLSLRFWTVVTTDVLFWNAGIHKNTASFLLWIKSLRRYSPARINELGTISPALGIAYTLIACFASDMFLGPAWAITFCSAFNALGLIFLTIWTVPEPALWFGFATMYWSNALSSVFHGWVNNLLRDSPEERSFTLVLINLLSQSSTAWTPLLTYPTVEAPRYRKGYSFCLGCALALIVFTWIMHYYLKRDKRSAKSDSDVEMEAREDDGSKPVVQRLCVDGRVGGIRRDDPS